MKLNLTRGYVDLDCTHRKQGQIVGFTRQIEVQCPLPPTETQIAIDDLVLLSGQVRIHFILDRPISF